MNCTGDSLGTVQLLRLAAYVVKTFWHLQDQQECQPVRLAGRCRAVRQLAKPPTARVLEGQVQATPPKSPSGNMQQRWRDIDFFQRGTHEKRFLLFCEVLQGPMNRSRNFCRVFEAKFGFEERSLSLWVVSMSSICTLWKLCEVEPLR